MAQGRGLGKRGSGTAIRLRNAFSIVLAYALLLQVIFTGMAAERMSFAAMGGQDVLCVSAGSDADRVPALPPDHRTCCAVCAFEGLTPLLAQPVGLIVPQLSVHAADQTLAARLVLARNARHEPRTSQGPPLTA
ncbi:hypothetical protein [Xanthobacter autotrophicus]|uniref:hypothetical protein n=1 Tax=Xanthobacter autotrophicus TaxID=280 RepID=UPI00372B7895